MWHSNILQWAYYVCTPTLLSNPMHVAGHIVSLNIRSLPTSQCTASSTTLFSHVWLDSTQCRLWNRDVLKWKTSDIKTSSRTKTATHDTTPATTVSFTGKMTLPRLSSESSVSRDCYWSWKGWSSPSELLLHDSLWSRPRGSKIPPAKGATDEVGGIGQWLVVGLGPGWFWIFGNPLIKRDCYLRDTPIRIPNPRAPNQELINISWWNSFQKKKILNKLLWPKQL